MKFCSEIFGVFLLAKFSNGIGSPGWRSYYDDRILVPPHPPPLPLPPPQQQQEQSIFFPGALDYRGSFINPPERNFGGGGTNFQGRAYGQGQYFSPPMYGQPPPRPRMDDAVTVAASVNTPCPSGLCLHPSQCTSLKGSPLPKICPGANAVCCHFENSCTHSTSEAISYFKSPGYPAPTLGNLICQYDVIIGSGVCAVRFDFLEFNTTIPLDRGLCHIDQLLVMNSLEGATFPRCGDLTGYSTIVSVDARHKLPITLLSIIQSSAEQFKWNIKVTQIKCSAVPPVVDYPNCGKTFTEADSSTGPTTPPDTTPIPRADDENTIFDEDAEQIYFSSSSSTTKQVDNAFYIAYLKEAYEAISNSTNSLGGNTTLCKNKKEDIHPQEKDKLLLRSDDYELARIIRGDEAFPNEFPWQVSIQDDKGHVCGGAIISATRILTAAHCYMSVEPVPLAKMKVVIGDLNFNSTTEAKEEIVGVESVTFHSHFDPYYLENDIAVIRLKAGITFRAGVQPICLPEVGNSYTGKDAVISGWGATTYPQGKLASYLMKSRNKIIENSECKKKLKIDYLWNTMICAIAPNCSGTCYGDSGGPLVVKGDQGKNTLVGLVSFGIGGCALFPYWPDVYTRVTAYLDWLAYAVY